MNIKAPTDATHRSQKSGNFYKFVGNTLMVWQVSGNKPGWFNSLHSYSAAGLKPLVHLVRQPDPPLVWDGEDPLPLPPVGTVCEVIPHNTLWGFSVLGTYPGTILAYHDDFVWIDVGLSGVPVSTRTDKVDFRPLRTAEQIAAAEREEAINELASSIGRGTFIQDATHIYDELGYRKQVAP